MGIQCRAVGFAAALLLGANAYAQSARTPFTAELERITYGGLGAEQQQIRDLVTVRSQKDGRRSESLKRWITLPAFSAREEYMEWKTIVDPGTKLQIVEYPLLSRKTTTALSAQDAQALQSAAADSCVPRGDSVRVDESPVPSSIMGVRVVKVTETVSEENGEYRTVREEWKAPELGCLTLQANSVVEKKGAPVNRHETRSLSLVREQPADHHFVPQAAFIETAPSAVLAEDSAARGKAMTDSARSTGARGDAAYYRQRPR